MPKPPPATLHAAPSEERRNFIARLGSSHFNYWFGYVANISLVIWLASHAVVGGRMALSPPRLALYAITGFFSWTLSEYLLHRYVYHVWNSFLSQGHGLHHESPRALIGVPWYLTTVGIIVVFYAVGWLTSFAATGVFMAANWAGYILYCLFHHGSHHWAYSTGWLKKMKRHHLIHHAHPAYNWGFTTPWWDLVFRTHYDQRPAAATVTGEEPRARAAAPRSSQSAPRA